MPLSSALPSPVCLYSLPLLTANLAFLHLTVSLACVCVAAALTLLLLSLLLHYNSSHEATEQVQVTEWHSRPPDMDQPDVYLIQNQSAGTSKSSALTSNVYATLKFGDIVTFKEQSIKRIFTCLQRGNRFYKQTVFSDCLLLASKITLSTSKKHHKLC